MDPRDDSSHAKPEQAHVLVHPGLPRPIGRGHAGDDGVLAAVLPDSGCDPYNGKYNGKQRKQHGTQAERHAPAAALCAPRRWPLPPHSGSGRGVDAAGLVELETQVRVGDVADRQVGVGLVHLNLW